MKAAVVKRTLDLGNKLNKLQTSPKINSNANLKMEKRDSQTENQRGITALGERGILLRLNTRWIVRATDII